MVYKQEQDQPASPGLNNLTYEQVNVITNAVKLWIEYFFWMRSLIEYTINAPERLPFIAGKLYNDVIPKFYSLFEFFLRYPVSENFYHSVYKLYNRDLGADDGFEKQ